MQRGVVFALSKISNSIQQTVSPENVKQPMDLNGNIL